MTTETVWTSIALDATDAAISTSDRGHPESSYGRIVNINIGPLSLMVGGRDEATTLATLLRLREAIDRLIEASQDRLQHEEVPA